MTKVSKKVYSQPVFGPWSGILVYFEEYRYELEHPLWPYRFEKNYDDSVLNRTDINLALNLQGQLSNGIKDEMKQTTKEILPYTKKSWAWLT